MLLLSVFIFLFLFLFVLPGLHPGPDGVVRPFSRCKSTTIFSGKTLCFHLFFPKKPRDATLGTAVQAVAPIEKVRVACVYFGWGRPQGGPGAGVPHGGGGHSDTAADSLEPAGNWRK